MEIILEGPDNAGKSTLATYLGKALDRNIVSSEGREKHPGEINERVQRYFATYRNVVFDRHPVISQSIYFICGNKTSVNQDLVDKFYRENNLFIYCRPADDRGLAGHIEKAYDDPAFLKEIADKYGQLLFAYDKWALNYANIIYRIGDPIKNIINQIEGVLNNER